MTWRVGLGALALLHCRDRRHRRPPQAATHLHFRRRRRHQSLFSLLVLQDSAGRDLENTLRAANRRNGIPAVTARSPSAKHITVIWRGAEVGRFSTISGNAVTIAAGASDDVVLSGLVISGQGKGSTGIRITRRAASRSPIPSSRISTNQWSVLDRDSIDATAKTNVFISDSHAR